MPRMAEIGEPVLRALASELRYAPRAALLRHIERAEELAWVLEPEQQYPREWVVFRVTGYRGSDGEGVMPKGADVLASLSAFVEALCEAAGYGAEDVPPGSMRAEDLCAHWRIGRKTLDRARRKGLVARRVCGVGAERWLMYTPRAIEAYEAREHPAPKPQGKRVSTLERERLVRRAGRYRRVLGLSRHQCAQRLSVRFGLSVEGVRRLLLRECGELFTEAGPPSAREQCLAARALRRGIEPREIARRLGRTSESVWRASIGYRVRLLKSVDRSGMVDGAAEEGWREDCVAAALIPTDVAGLVSIGRETSVMDRQGEHEAARGLRHVRVQANAAIERAIESGASREVDLAETLLRRHSRIKEVLVASQLGLLVGTAERRLGQAIDASGQREARGLVDAMFEALVLAVDGFDPAHGGRLAARTGLAMDRAAAAWLRDRPQLDRRQGLARRALVVRDDIMPRRRGVDEWSNWLELDPRVEWVLAHGWVGDADLLRWRFGLEGHWAMTLEQASQRLGLPEMHTARRERALIRAALAAARQRIR